MGNVGLWCAGKVLYVGMAVLDAWLWLRGDHRARHFARA